MVLFQPQEALEDVAGEGGGVAVEPGDDIGSDAALGGVLHVVEDGEKLTAVVGDVADVFAI